MSRPMFRSAARPVSRRVLLASLAATAPLCGCDMLGDLFTDDKKPLPGRREAIGAVLGGDLKPALTPAEAAAAPLSLPPVRANADWPQPGGNPAHAMGRLAGGGLHQVWQADIGEGGGYREKLTARPVVAAGRVFAMDSDGVVSAYAAASGERAWRRGTRPKGSRSGNVGGGIAWDGGRLYAATGRAELIAMEAGDGRVLWRRPLGDAARSAPTIEAGRVFVMTIDGRLLGFSADRGDALWSYQSQSASTVLLGQPAPAAADGLVVAGFGSGELVALQADTGAVSWSENLGSVSGRDSLSDLSSIRGMPVIDDGRVYAVGLGGLMVALDLRTGRRLWERELASGDTPWIAGDWLFTITTGQVLAAMSVADGRVRWATPLPRYKKPRRARGPIYWRGPVLAGDRLLLAGNDGVLLAADPRTGRIGQRLELSAPAPLAPVVAGGTTFLVADDGSLTAYR